MAGSGRAGKEPTAGRAKWGEKSERRDEPKRDDEASGSGSGDRVAGSDEHSGTEGDAGGYVPDNGAGLHDKLAVLHTGLQRRNLRLIGSISWRLLPGSKDRQIASCRWPLIHFVTAVARFAAARIKAVFDGRPSKVSSETATASMFYSTFLADRSTLL